MEQIAAMLRDQQAAIRSLEVLRSRGGICAEAAAAVQTCFDLSLLLERHGNHVMRIAVRLGDFAKRDAGRRQAISNARKIRHSKKGTR
jgi:hypothetical protein